MKINKSAFFFQGNNEEVIEDIIRRGKLRSKNGSTYTVTSDIENQLIEAEDQKNKLRIDVNDLEMKNENLLNELEHMKSEIIMAEKEINQVKQRLDEETLKLNKKEEELQNERLEIVSLCKMYEERLKQSEKDQNNIEKENKKMIEDLKIKIETTTELEANPYELDEQIKSEDNCKL